MEKTIAFLGADQWISSFSGSGPHTGVGTVNSIDELNKWLGLAMNIWNNTPQPDRSGKSPFEIGREYDGQRPNVQLPSRRGQNAHYDLMV